MSEKRGKRSKKSSKDKKSPRETSPIEPFVLTYDSRQYSRWRECMAIKAKLLYGALGNLCDTDKLEDIAALDPANYDIANANAVIATMARATLQADIGERQK